MAVRIALRTLFRSRWQAVATIGTIALTISLSSTVFAVVDGVLFKPLPYPDADRLYFADGADAAGETGRLSALDVQYLAGADARVGVCPIASSYLALDRDRPHQSVNAGLIGINCLEVLGVRPLLGGFLPEHFTVPAAGALRPALITYQAWRRWLPGETNPVGRTLDLPGARLTVVGVLPKTFVSVFGGIREIVAVLPFVSTPAAASDRWNRSIHKAVIRLPPGLTLTETQGRFDASLAARASEYPPAKDESARPYVGVRLTSVETDLGAVQRRSFTVAFLGAVLLVLLGATNVTALTVARAASRLREFDVRSALGASRVALVTLWLIDAAAIAMIGAAAGLALAPMLVQFAASLVPWMTQLPAAPAVDWRVAAFALLAAVTPLLLTSAVPAVAASRRAGNSELVRRGRSDQGRPSWARSVLLTAQTAIGATLVLVGCLMLGGYVLLRSEDVGFDPEHLAIVELARPRGETREHVDAREALAFDRIRQVRGVHDVAIIGVQFHGRLQQISSTQFRAPGPAATQTGSMSSSVYELPVSGRFFEIAGLRLIAGRYPSRTELDEGRPVAVVNDLAARAFFGGEPPLGRELFDGKQTVTIVGVVEHALFASQWRYEFAQLYYSIRLKTQPTHRIFLVQTVGNPDPVAGAIGVALKRDLPGAIVARSESMNDALVQGEPVMRFQATLYGAAGGAALLIVSIGIGGLVATMVASRIREIGIRAALGARPAQLVRLVVATQLRPVLIGLAIGLVASWWTSKLVRAYRYDSHDVRVWVAAAAIILCAAMVAAWIPARRASRVDPTIALRAE